VSGVRKVGGVAGHFFTQTLINVTNHGTVEATDDSAGGLVGSLQQATILRSINHGDVSADGHSSGGITGACDSGTITNTTNNGDVNGGEGVGGIVGRSYPGSQVEISRNLGSVSGEDHMGGVIGYNEGTLTDSYSQGAVSGINTVGGLVGNNTGTVDDTYSSGAVAGTGYEVGGLVGNDTGTVTDSFWDTDTSGQATSDGGTGKNTTEMMDVNTYYDATWVLAPEWAIRHGVTYPYFGWDDDNVAPVAHDDQYTIAGDSILEQDDTEVLVNDMDPDWGRRPMVDGWFNLTAELVGDSSALGAAVQINANGSFTYDPTAAPAFDNLSYGQMVQDTFTYIVSDGLGLNDTATVTINVTGYERSPSILFLTLPDGVVGKRYAVDYDHQDLNGDQVVWSMESDAQWLEVNGFTGEVEGIPTKAGTYWIQMEVTDTTYRSDMVNLTFTIIPDQDGDGIPDNLDIDRDGDGYNNEVDAFPDDISESQDSDGDGTGDNRDKDDDGDGWTDIQEAVLGTDSLSNASEPADLDDDGIPDIWDDDDDGDGWPDVVEALAGMDARDAASKPTDANADGIPDSLARNPEASDDTETETPTWAYMALVAAIVLGLLLLVIHKRK